MEMLIARLPFRIALPDGPSKEWMDYTLRIDTHAPWLKTRTKKLIDNFETVVASRWPTVQDIRAPQWSRVLLKVAELVALCAPRLQLPVRTPVGQRVYQSAQAEARELMSQLASLPARGI